MIDRPTIVAIALTIGLLLGNRVDAAAKSTATPTALQCGGAAMATSAAGVPAPPTVSPPASDASVPLQPVADIPLPGSASRFDYQSLDATSGLLYIAHMGADQVIVFDTRAQRVVGVVTGIDTPTGILAVPALDRIFVAVAGSHNVAVIGADSLDVVARVGQIGFPDGLAYAPPVNQIFVSDESGGGELVIDAETNEIVTTIDIGGEAGNTHYDPVSGCVIVAVQSRNQLAAIDPVSDRLIARYDLDADCNSPHGFLIDAPRRAAYVTCEDNATLLVVDLRTMQISETYPVGASPDVLAFDPGWQRLYVASEAGVVSVFAAYGAHLQPIGKYRAPHAHSVTVDPATHDVYLPLKDVNGKPVLRILHATPPPD